MTPISTQTAALEEQRWNALQNRRQDSTHPFFYGVCTTGIYCRPTCASRLPNRENVRFFETNAEAERAGFRPCKRCTPDKATAPDIQNQIVLEVCRRIQESSEMPSIQELADAVGWSASYLQHTFKEVMGVTPKKYIQSQLLNRVRQELSQPQTVTDALSEAGFTKNSRFYEQGTAALGMTPTTYKKGGKGMTIRYAVIPCFLGSVLIAATPKGICRIDIADDAPVLVERLHRAFPNAEFDSHNTEFEKITAQVIAYLTVPKRGLDSLPLDIQGTAFQQRVWAALQAIPAGTTATYTEIATHIGNPKAVRAVAQACAANTLAVAIPCHRVIRASGDLSGYRWGIERKRILLEQEAEQSV